MVTKWFGVFLCEEGKVLRKHLFEKDAEAIARKLAAVQRGEILPEEQQMARKGMKVADARLSKLGKPVVFDSSFIRAEDYSYTQELMHRTMVELGKLRTREPLAGDRCVLQAIRCIDDLNDTINLMSERLHEWYGLYFPELADYVRDERYAGLIAELGTRDRILGELDVELESVGCELEEEDIEMMRDLASELHGLYGRKSRLEEYVAGRMEAIAPNLAALVGASLGARLISLAGGLERLSRLPSSTVQLLGAEKAMFQHLKANKRPPKHGIIFQHPQVRHAQYWQRGKVARALAGKISIAAKLDHWQGEFMGDELRREFEARVEEIRNRYPSPPHKGKQRR